MKKKGFTLIELISVIVVLGVLAIIAVPTVTNQIDDTKKETYKASVRSVFDSVSTYLAKNKDLDDIPNSGIIVPEGEIYKQLDLKNQIFVSGLIYRDEDGVMKVQNLSDGTYCASGSKNDLRVVSGVCDKLDITEPVINIYESRITSGSITIVVNSSDNESGITSFKYYLNGKFIEETKNNVYTYKNLKANTKYHIEVKSVNGNNQEATAAVDISTKSGEIIFKVVPEDWSRSKNLTVLYPEQKGEMIYQYQVVGKTDWVTVPGMTTDILIEENTTVNARVVQNEIEVIQSQKTFNKIDKEAPTIDSIEGNHDGWAISKPITIKATDSKSGLAPEAYSFDGGNTWQESATKTLTANARLKVVVRDNIGNTSAVKDIVVEKIDPTIPQTPQITAIAGRENYESGSWTNNNVELKANPKPVAPSGYKYQWYKKSGSSYVAIEGATNQTYVVSIDDQSTYKVDVQTNAGSAVVPSNTYDVKVDKTSPNVELTGLSLTTNSAKVTFTASDTGVGLNKKTCVYGIDANYEFTGTISGNTCTLSNLKTGTTYYYQICAMDKVGNSTTCKVGSTNPKSLEKPSVSFTNTPEKIQNGYLKQQVASVAYISTGITSPRYFIKTTRPGTSSVTVINKCGTETEPSGCTEASGNSLAVNTWYEVIGNVNVTYSTSATQQEKQKSAVIYATIYDGTNFSGNVTGTLAEIDRTSPVLTIGTITITPNSATIPFTLTDSESGVGTPTCKYSTTSGSYTTAGTISGNTCKLTGLKSDTTYYYQICSADKVGNNPTCKTGTVTSYTATGYSGKYDGKAHGITVTSSGATIKYGTTSGSYTSTTSPTYTDVGTYTVYYQIVKAGYNTVTGSETVVIEKENNILRLSANSGSYTFPTKGTFTVTQNTSGGALSCTSSNTSIATCSVSGTTITVTPGTTTGAATLTIKSAATGNYNAAQVAYVATTLPGVQTVTVNGYSGTYDGKAHGITVTSSGATIKYGTVEGSYTSTTSPTYTDAGTYTVYYQVTKAGYTTVQNSKQVVIGKAPGTVTLSATSGTIDVGSSTTFTASGATGALICTSTSIATCSISGTTVTVKGIKDGTATITVKVAESTNYSATSKTYSLTVNVIAPTIVWTNTPSTAQNGYYKQQVATVTFNDSNISNVYFYFKSRRKAKIDNVAYSCGTSTEPTTCEATGTTDLEASTWYRINKNTNITYDEPASEEATVYAAMYSGTELKSAITSIAHKIDRTSPTITIGTVSSTKNSITIPYTLIDSESGVGSYTCKYVDAASQSSISNASFSTDGSSVSTTSCTLSSLKEYTKYYYQICATDKVGNNTSCQTGEATTKDATAPSTPTITLRLNSSSGSTYTSGSWTNQNVYHIVNSSDSGSGIAYYQYSHDGYTWITLDWGSANYYNNKTQLHYLINWAGNWNFYIRAVDNAGNVSKNSSMFTVRIDKTAPSLSGLNNASGGQWINKAFEVSYNVAESASGIARCQYKYASDILGNCNDWCNENNTVSNGVFKTSFSYQRNTTAYFRCIDNAGNVSNTLSTSIRIDNTAPTITYNYSNIASNCTKNSSGVYSCTGTTPAIYSSCTDSGGSGVNYFSSQDVQWKCDYKINTTGEQLSIKVCSPGSTRTVYSSCADAAGNVATKTSDKISRTRSGSYNCMYTNMYNGATCGDSSTSSTAAEDAGDWKDTTVMLNKYDYASAKTKMETNGYVTCSGGIRVKYTACSSQLSGPVCSGSPDGVCYRCIKATKADSAC